MTATGADLRGTEDWQDAVDVGRETMGRVRQNVERLVERLRDIGYQFAAPDAVFTPPAADIGAQLDDLEGTIGALPLALRCWYEQVGQVNLNGHHPEWDYDYPDPLVVEAPIEYVLSEYELWVADRGTEWERAGFEIDLAPDYLHKANVSGGAPYEMAVPDRGVDGLLLGECHDTTFVNYLRICFRWGGFPGWDRGALDGWARPPAPRPYSPSWPSPSFSSK